MYSLANSIFNEIDSNFIGIFLYGSQNYGLDNEESDKDAIVLVKENDRASRQKQLKTGIVKIYTLKYFLSRLQKGDMECYEILYTKYRYINEEYKEVFDSFVTEYTGVLNIDRVKHALAKKLVEHLSNVAWIPFNRDNSKYHRKRVYWSYRVSDQLKRVVDGEYFPETFVYDISKREELLKIKTITNYLPLRQLDGDLKQMYAQLRELPKYNIETTPEEEKCFSKFYEGMWQ